MTLDRHVVDSLTQRQVSAIGTTASSEQNVDGHGPQRPLIVHVRDLTQPCTCRALAWPVEVAALAALRCHASNPTYEIDDWQCKEPRAKKSSQKRPRRTWIRRGGRRASVPYFGQHQTAGCAVPTPTVARPSKYGNGFFCDAVLTLRAEVVNDWQGRVAPRTSGVGHERWASEALPRDVRHHGACWSVLHVLARRAATRHGPRRPWLECVNAWAGESSVRTPARAAGRLAIARGLRRNQA